MRLCTTCSQPFHRTRPGTENCTVCDKCCAAGWITFNLHRFALRNPPEHRFVTCPYKLPNCKCSDNDYKSDQEFLKSIHVSIENPKYDTDESFLKACGITV